MNTQETKSAIVEFLARCDLSFSVSLVGATKRDDWECDEWRVTLKSGRTDYSVPYYTGKGHRKVVRGFTTRNFPGARLVNGIWQAERAQAPSAASVLHSLLLDGSAIDQSFIDWCDHSSCNTDSRKALTAYEACCESGRKMRQLFTCAQREELSNLLQDF